MEFTLINEGLGDEKKMIKRGEKLLKSFLRMSEKKVYKPPSIFNM